MTAEGTDGPRSANGAIDWPVGDRELVDLGREECLRLLHGADIGRVIYTDGALPAVTPVNYVLSGNRVVLRTTDDSRVARKVPGTVVAFEVDELEVGARAGWSVVATGLAQLVTDPVRLQQVAAMPLTPWASGNRPTVIEIPTTLLTGRRIGSAGSAIQDGSPVIDA